MEPDAQVFGDEPREIIVAPEHNSNTTMVDAQPSGLSSSVYRVCQMMTAAIAAPVSANTKPTTLTKRRPRVPLHRNIFQKRDSSLR